MAKKTQAAPPEAPAEATQEAPAQVAPEAPPEAPPASAPQAAPQAATSAPVAPEAPSAPPQAQAAPVATVAPVPDREAELEAKLAAIGDPYGRRQEINASIIAAKEELAEIQREYKASIAKLEDEFRDAEEKARWLAEDKRLLEIELAKVRGEKASKIATDAADAAAKAVRAQVEKELAASGVRS